MKYKKIDINYEINKIDTRNKLKLKNFHYKKQYLQQLGILKEIIGQERYIQLTAECGSSMKNLKVILVRPRQWE